MKKVIISIALFAITAGAYAQLKINHVGMVTINARTINWESALKTTVPTQYSCAYNLWNTYYNKDVFFVCGDGYLWCLKGGYFGSDITLKKNISPIEGSLKKVKSLQGVRYQYKDEKESDEDFRLGFIAQDVEKVFPEVVKDMPDGTKAICYTDLIAVLVEAVKEQQTQIENLQAMVEECCSRDVDYSPSKKSMKNNIQDENSSIDENSAKLFQNIPNPFAENTEIKFEIPQNSTSAKLLIHDMQGSEIKSYSINQKGLGSIIISGFELPAGMYMYTLLVNNTIVDTKKMILTK